MVVTSIFRHFNRLIRQVKRGIVYKFKSKCSLLDVPMPVSQHSGWSTENIATVRASVNNQPNQSIPRHSQELWNSRSPLWRFLRKDLHPCKMKLTEELKFLDHLKCWKISHSEFHWKNIFSDKGLMPLSINKITTTKRDCVG